jgi:hypothetical protein
MTAEFVVGTRPRPYLLPRLRVVGDLLRFETCPLRYRLHAVGGWPEADTDDAPRLAGILVHVALDHAGTACRPVASGGAGHPVEEGVADRAIEAARRAIDAISPRARRSPAVETALDEATGVARHLILAAGPELFPVLAATERRLSATRPYVGPQSAAPRRRRVDRFEISGVLDAITVPIDPQTPKHCAVAAMVAKVAGAALPRDEPVEAIIDYKLARRPRAAITTGDDGRGPGDGYAFQVAAYAALHQRFREPRPLVGLVLYLYDVADADLGAPGAGGIGDGASTATSPLERAAQAIPLDVAAIAQATSRIDRLAAGIEACAEREAAGEAPRRAWPARPSGLCARCDLRPVCPARPSGWDGPGPRDPAAGEREDA